MVTTITSYLDLSMQVLLYREAAIADIMESTIIIIRDITMKRKEVMHGGNFGRKVKQVIVNKHNN